MLLCDKKPSEINFNYFKLLFRCFFARSIIIVYNIMMQNADMESLTNQTTQRMSKNSNSVNLPHIFYSQCRTFSRRIFLLGEGANSFTKQRKTNLTALLCSIIN